MATALAAQNSVDLPRMGVATGLVNFTRQLGGAVGVAVAASVMLTRLDRPVDGALRCADRHRRHDVLTPAGQQHCRPSVRAQVGDAFAGALHSCS